MKWLIDEELRKHWDPTACEIVSTGHEDEFVLVDHSLTTDVAEGTYMELHSMVYTKRLIRNGIHCGGMKSCEERFFDKDKLDCQGCMKDAYAAIEALQSEYGY